MNIGFDHSLYLLPFDHRHSYITGMFHAAPPLSAAMHDAVAGSKQLIYDGFRQALDPGMPAGSAGILVDEEFGAAILHDATRRGYITALSTERSGRDEFEFEYGTGFRAHIEAFQPVFAKALVRYNPEGDPALNRRQVARLRQLSEYCHSAGHRFMFELLVPATAQQAEHARANRMDYSLAMRPGLVIRAIGLLQDAGVEPDVWKVEGLPDRERCEQVVAAARLGGRDHVGCIVLGHGMDEKQVVSWLETAATVPGFIGFAVGRTTFWGPVADYLAHRTTRQEAVARIARRYREWIATFERSRSALHQATP